MYNKMNNGEEVAADHLLTTRNPNNDVDVLVRFSPIIESFYI